MKICVISDTHTKHQKLTIPECDVLIHAGDFTWTGKYWEVMNFLRWFHDQPARHKIFIAGNHEETFDRTHPKFSPRIASLVTLYDDIIYLENQACEVDGIKFYGTPWTPWFYDWGFNGVEGGRPPEEGKMLRDIYGHIPQDTNVLICHGPPYDILDKSNEGDRTGSVEMRKLLESDKFMDLRLYLCGHIHEARGHEIACGGVHICNVASLERDYEMTHPPVIIELDEDGFVKSVEGYEE